ncbi:MAG: hypothetical protein ABI972_23145 [Acidobacteriota bacterium]
MAEHLHYKYIMGKQYSQSNYLCSDLVTVQIAEPCGRQLRITANLEEIGPKCLSLLVDSAIVAGSQVTVETRGVILRGQARKAEHSQDLGWFIEVRLAPDSRWSRARYTPAHILAPAVIPEPAFCRHGVHLR